MDAATKSETVPTALVIDDNADACRIEKMALESIGYKVTVFEDSTQGLESINWNTYDLVVLDLMMPKVNGAQILRQMRDMPLHRGARVIVLSANINLANSQVGDLADQVMYKPIDVPTFISFAQRFKERPETKAAKI